MIKRWIEKIVDQKNSKVWDSDRSLLKELVKSQLEIESKKINKYGREEIEKYNKEIQEQTQTWIDGWNKHLKEMKENAIKTEKHNRLIEGWLKIFMEKNGVKVD